MVDYNGLENRRAERHRGFESLSLRKQGCKSASYAIYTLYYTLKDASKKSDYLVGNIFFVCLFQIQRRLWHIPNNEIKAFL